MICRDGGARLRPAILASSTSIILIKFAEGERGYILKTEYRFLAASFKFLFLLR